MKYDDVLTRSAAVSIGTGNPNFADSEFLEAHIEKTLAFYAGARDPHGGFFHCFKDDGSVYDQVTRHLVSSTRFIINFARAARRYPSRPHFVELARHGLSFLETAHRQRNGSYAWELTGNLVKDERVMAYGHAFVLLAAASALRAGISEARTTLEQAWRILEEYFWEEEMSAYRDEFDGDLSVASPYRGQNANMHIVEAAMAAFAATGEYRFLDRAEAVAAKFCGPIADVTGSLIWEHFSQSWAPDFEYNHDRPNDLFKPWGFQPGHQFEWSRLLLSLEGIRPQSWYLARAVALYSNGMIRGADPIYGGVVYGFAPDGTVSSSDKYHWVHSEGFAAAWRLYRRTGEDRYRGDYEMLWDFCWKHLVDHQYGAWFRVVTRDGNKIDDLKSPPGKADYHTLGACWDVLDH